MSRRFVAAAAALGIVAAMGFAATVRPQAMATSDVAAVEPVPDYGPLESKVREYIAGDRAAYGIYFLDLESGAGFGINEDMPVPQASTVKVPLVLYVNRLVESGGARWSDRVTYTPASDYRDGAGALQYFAAPGTSYSLRVLSNLAITLSDNAAKAMLVRHVGSSSLKDFMRSLGAKEVHTDGGESTTARDMALYLQGVLDLARDNPELGNRLIDDLSHTIWHVGIPGRLPDGLRVAHKEGDITGVSNDVGIVFARHPYILCVLSKGQGDVEAGFARIAEISRIVYDYQEQIRP